MGASIRIKAGDRAVTGKLVKLTKDSLVLVAKDTESFERTAIDTAWRRPSGGASGFEAGLVFGALAAGLILLAGRSTDEPGLSGSIAVGVGLGAVLVGAAISSLGPGWHLVYSR